jgi:hypothetical protein
MNDGLEIIILIELIEDFAIVEILQLLGFAGFGFCVGWEGEAERGGQE